MEERRKTVYPLHDTVEDRMTKAEKNVYMEHSGTNPHNEVTMQDKGTDVRYGAGRIKSIR